MERSRRPWGMRIIVAAVLTVLPLAGCSVQIAKQELSEPSPGENARPIPPEGSADQPRTIGVVTAPFPSTVDYASPARGGATGAAIGAAKGLGLGILTGVEKGNRLH
ncbi:MAG: hypothetical protein H6Q33_2540 [Deltaproteobacteria bacterium]|nr:hypothetical protein [Deltaproteobacteria bacterium]